jgi:hypothetical protein
MSSSIIANGRKRPRAGPSSGSASSSKGRAGNAEVAQGTGLKNLGNTCFLNSVVQNLYHLRLWRTVMEANSADGGDGCGDGSSSGVDGGGGAGSNHELDSEALERSMRDLFQAMGRYTGGAVAPTHFVDALALRVPVFAARQQQDAAEALRYLLDFMDIEANEAAPDVAASRKAVEGVALWTQPAPPRLPLAQGGGLGGAGGAGGAGGGGVGGSALVGGGAMGGRVGISGGFTPVSPAALFSPACAGGRFVAGLPVAAQGLLVAPGAIGGGAEGEEVPSLPLANGDLGDDEEEEGGMVGGMVVAARRKRGATHELFTGSLRSIVHCTACKSTLTVAEEFRVMSLPVAGILLRKKGPQLGAEGRYYCAQKNNTNNPYHNGAGRWCRRNTPEVAQAALVAHAKAVADYMATQEALGQAVGALQGGARRGRGVWVDPGKLARQRPRRRWPRRRRWPGWAARLPPPPWPALFPAWALSVWRRDIA